MVDDEMSTEDITAQYIERLLDFHLSTGTPPSQFLTLGNLTKCPTLLIDKRLDSLDWDTMPGLFDHLDTVKTTHIDLDIVTSQWMNESFDVFNLDGVVSHNLVLVLFLTPNHEARIESSNEVLGDYVFSAVVMYKLMAQCTCSLCSTVNDLCVFAQEKTPALAFISLSEEASYFPFPLTADHVNYAIVLVDNIMTQVIGLTLGFIVGQLLRMIEDDVMNIVLPSAFGTDADTQDFDWIPHPVRRVMWSNYQFIDTENGDFTHMVLVAPLDVFRVDLGDQVCRSPLGICPVPPLQFTYQTDLMKVGYDVTSQFTLALQRGKSLTAAASTGVADPTNPVDTGATGQDTVPKDDPWGTSKATENARSSPL